VKKTLFSISIVFFFLTNIGFSQNNQLINSGELIEEGIEFHDAGRYEKAMECYNMVSRNDTNYAWALVEKAITFTAMEKFNDAVEICLEGLNLESEYNNHFYNSLGTAYDNLERNKEAIDIYEKAIKEFPNNYLLHFNLGVAHRVNEDWNSAIVSFETAADLNIFHASSHLFLGITYAEQGRLVPSLMAFGAFLAIEPTSERSSNVISYMESLISGEAEIDAPSEEHVMADAVYQEVRLIIESKAALDKKYKSLVKVYDPLIKQLQVMCEKLEYDPENKDFMMRTYVPFYKSMLNEGHYPTYAYCIFVTVGSKKVQKWLKKNKAKINDYIEWANSKLSDIRDDKEVTIDGKVEHMSFWYYNNNALQAIGNVDDLTKKDQEQIGYWQYFNPTNGAISSKAHFNDKGERHGESKWYYNDGKIKEVGNYVDGKAEGVVLNYYENGALEYEIPYVNDTINGEVKEYTKSGCLASQMNFVNGKRNGLSKYYYLNGDLHYETTFIDNDRDSVFIEYYHDGSISMKYSMKKGERDGEYKEYYEDGSIKVEGQYKDDESVGEWKWYFEDGKTELEKSFNDKGESHGEVKSYYENGKLEQEYNLVDGDLDGANNLYDEDGKKYATYEYKNDVMVSCVFYDKEGKEISNAEARRGVINFVSHYPDGYKRGVGMHKNGEREGLWTFYHRNGQISAEENYKDGKMHGEAKYYFKNGKISSEMTYAEGDLDGYYKSYYRKGNLSYEGWYKNDKRQGDWYSYQYNDKLDYHQYYTDGEIDGYQVYYHIDGTINYEYHKKYGIPYRYIYYDTLGNVIHTITLDKGTGKFSSVHPDGSKKGDCEFKCTEMQGPINWYHPNGKVEETGQYVNDERHGKFVGYYYNGKTSLEINYKNGKSNGEWKWYHKNGKLSSKANFKEGDRNGISKWYYENGKLETTSGYKEDERHGDRIDYDISGKVRLKRVYQYGTLIAYSYLGKNGKYVENIPVENETVKIEAYYSNGKKSVEMTYVLGYLSGKCTIYYSNGQIYNEVEYVNGEREGVRKIYYTDGTLKAEESYYYGELNGECKYYYTNGKLERVEYYYLDEKHGDWIYYNKEGKEIKKEVWRYDDIYQ